MSGPLAGTKVLDLTNYIAGPFACGLLADLGAEVIKIESPEGDMARRLPSTLPIEDSRMFMGLNRSKRSLVLDLKREAGKEVLRRLAKDADVLVENFRPGVMEGLQLGYDALARDNPQLVYFALSGYGEGGPLRDNPGFDMVLQSLSGIAVYQGAAAGPPQIVVGSILDYFAGSFSALGVTAALKHRSETGLGQRVTSSLLATALALQAGRFVWADGEPREVNRDMVSGKIAGIHPTREGHLYLSAL